MASLATRRDWQGTTSKPRRKERAQPAQLRQAAPAPRRCSADEAKGFEAATSWSTFMRREGHGSRHRLERWLGRR